MKSAFLSLTIVCLSIANVAFALNKVVTVEGPVEIISSPTAPETTTYWIEDGQHVKYRVVLPEDERIRLASVIKTEPSSVIRFDGTLVDDDKDKVLSVSKWQTITKTTTVTDELGNTKTTQEKTTVLK